LFAEILLDICHHCKTTIRYSINVICLQLCSRCWHLNSWRDDLTLPPIQISRSNPNRYRNGYVVKWSIGSFLLR
jgi:hypothetical protein